MARSLEPQHVTDSDWFYENKGHMLFVHEVRDKAGLYVQTDQIKIPWRKIEASLKRVRASKRRASQRGTGEITQQQFDDINRRST